MTKILSQNVLNYENEYSHKENELNNSNNNKDNHYMIKEKRLVIWPRGCLLFSTNFCGIPLQQQNFANNKFNNNKMLSKTDEDWDSVVIALRLLYYYFYNNRTRKITFCEWRRIALQKIRFGEELLFAIFIIAKNMTPNLAKSMPSINDPYSNMDNEIVDLLDLVTVISLLGCRNRKKGIMAFFKRNLEKISWLFILHHFEMASKFIQSSKFNEQLLPSKNCLLNSKIPLKALDSFNVLFEGTLFPKSNKNPIVTANILPQSFSNVFSKQAKFMGIVDWENQILFSDLLALLTKSLQADMFLLDDFSTIHWNLQKTWQNSRSITSTQLAEHRKITLRACSSRMEILMNPLYRGANLRVLGGENYSVNKNHHSSAIFHLCFLKSVCISDSERIGSILLGPVKDVVRIERVQNASISVLANRIWIEDCQDLIIFANTSSPIMLIGQCQRIRIAPYNIFYDGLLYELKKSGMRLLNEKNNLWNKVIEVHSIYGNNEQNSEVCCSFSFLKPMEFYIQPTPFQQTETSSFYKEFIDTIPTEYYKKWMETKICLAKNMSKLKIQQKQNFLPFNRTDLNYLFKKIQQKR